MPPKASLHFQAESLRQRFIQNLDDAFREGRICEPERHWLGQLSDLESDDRDPADLPRVDQILLEDGSPVSSEMAGALLIYSRDLHVQPIYLDTLLHGLQRFDDREALLVGLQRQFAASDAFEHQQLEGDPFEQRMLLLIEQQVQHLRSLADELQAIPGLRQALALGLQTHLRALLPEVSVDLDAPLIHVIQAPALATERIPLNTVVDVLTPRQAVVVDFMGEHTAEGQRRQWLDATGRIQGEESGQLYRQALSRTCTAVKTDYVARLQDFWQPRDARHTTRREWLATAIAEGFRQQLLSASEDGTLGAQEFRQLSTLLQPVAVRLGHDYRIKVSRLVLAPGNQEPFKLIGLLLINSADWPGLLLYSTLKGWRRFDNEQALNAYYSGTPGREELLDHLSANDQVQITARTAVSLKPYWIEQGLFLDCADALIAWQQRNLIYALDRPRHDLTAYMAMVDDALDIRHLIDSRLLRMTGGGRWREQAHALTRLWPEKPDTATAPHKVVAMHGLLETGDPTLTSWADQVVALETMARELTMHCPSIKRQAVAALNEYLAAMGATMPDAQSIVVQWGQDGRDDRTARSPRLLPGISLPSLLLERITGRRDARMPDDSRILWRDPQDASLHAEPRLTPDLIDHFTDHIGSRLLDDYLQNARRYLSDFVRLPDKRLESQSLMVQIRFNLLYLESCVLKRSAILPATTLDALTQALTRPVAGLRQVFGADRVEVLFPSLVLDDSQPPLPMGNAFVLRQPAYSDRAWVCWSAVEGVLLVESHAELEEWLEGCLSVYEYPDRYLMLFREQDRQRLFDYLTRADRAPLRVRLTLIDGHFIEALQRNEQQSRLERTTLALDRSRRGRLPASLFERFIEMALTDNQLCLAFDSVASDIQNLAYTVQLPLWLKNATLSDMQRYIDMFDRYYLSNDPRADFLFDIPRLQRFAFEGVQRQLQQDFPACTLNPDTITVRLTHYIGAPVPTGEIPSGIAAVTKVISESLTLFALNHFSEIQGGVLSLEFPPNVWVPPALNSQYIESLVRNQDLGQHYRALLADKLDVDHPDYPLRRKRFIEQIPSRMLMLALEMNLQEKLGDIAYDYLQGLVDMPDSLARQPVRGQDIALHPLQLLPRQEMAADTVAGVYLIGPKGLGSGPVILHGLFSPAFSFKEYRDQEHFLSQLRSSPPLQALVLGRLEPMAVKRYSHGGFTEAHIPWSTESSLDVPLANPEPVSIAATPIAGNVLHYLFEETLTVFQDISRKQAVTTAQANWESFVYLMGLGTEQVFSFVPGKLGMLIAAWQSQSLFKASLDAAYDQNWGQALSEFSAALGGVISSRGEKEEVVPDEVQPGETVLHEFPVFSWKNSHLTTDLKNRLRAFEVHDRALNTLDKDPLLTLYRDPATDKQYAAVAGQVYQVRFAAQHWNIVDDTHVGPRIRLDTQQHWELDLQWGLLGGGGSLGRLRGSHSYQARVDDVFITEAVGMRAIRTISRSRAQMIDEARQLAIDYLQNSLYNLNPEAALDPRVGEILSDFFGVTDVDDALLDAVKDSVIRLFDGLNDPTLTPTTSNRFVMGRNRYCGESTMAFVVKDDQQQRIHLTERYFNPPAYGLNWRRQASSGFNADNHFRAATLLHELSHITNATHDIAYMDAAAPFPDMLDDSRTSWRDLKLELERMRTHGFSHLSPPHELFIVEDDKVWRDFVADDGQALSIILEVTGKKTLEQARSVFLNDPEKRRQLILKNADSVALLITLLGRRCFIN